MKLSHNSQYPLPTPKYVQCKVLKTHELHINGCRNSWNLVQRQCSIPQLCVDFFPTTYSSNNQIVNSNQGLGVVKCDHCILPQRKIGLVQQDSLREWQKEFEIVSMLVAFKQFMIPEGIQNKVFRHLIMCTTLSLCGCNRLATVRSGIQ